MYSIRVTDGRKDADQHRAHLMPIHTADADATQCRVESRRRCEHSSQLAHDDCRRMRSYHIRLNSTVDSSVASRRRGRCVIFHVTFISA